MKLRAAVLLILTVSAAGCGDRPPTYSPADFDEFSPKADPRVELVASGWADDAAIQYDAESQTLTVDSIEVGPQYELFDNSDDGNNAVRFNVPGVFTGIPPDSHITMKLSFNGWECTIYHSDPIYDMAALCGDPGALSFESTTLLSGLIGAYARRHDTAALEALSEFFAAHPIEGADTAP